MARILIVDDSPTLRTSAQFTLEAEGHEVWQAENGVAALDLLKSLPAGDAMTLKMIITDVNMPEMDGISFLTHVKATRFKYVPVLVMTTESQDDMKEKGRNAGAAGWLVKPYKPVQLVDVVTRFVS